MLPPRYLPLHSSAAGHFGAISRKLREKPSPLRIMRSLQLSAQINYPKPTDVRLAGRY
jgi:hypothetical protein